MQKEIKYYVLLLGLFLTLSSFLFFARAQGAYQLMLIGGGLVSIVFYAFIIFSKDGWKIKLLWTMIIFGSIILQRITEPILIKGSYMIYLNNHSQELLEVDKILMGTEYDISILNDNIEFEKGDLTLSEELRLKVLREELDVYLISKSKHGIYFGLWGFLDVRLGITLRKTKEQPRHGLKKLSGDWYY